MTTDITDRSTEALAELAHWGRERDLNELDTLMWRTERHPASSWTGVVLMMLDSAADWERFHEAHDWGLTIAPRFAERVVDPALPVGPSMWAPDPDFDLNYHVRRERLPAPGLTSQLMELCQRVALTPLDRTRPPWLSILIEGLEGGRSAWLIQAHHVIMDGAGFTQLFERVLGTGRAPRAVRPRMDTAPLGSAGPVGAVTRQLTRQAGRAPTLATRAVGATAGAVVHPRRAARFAASLRRVMSPPPPSASPLLAPGPRRTWRFGMLDCSLPDLKAAGKAVGGTVNDAFVCAILGGLRNYHAAKGQALDDVPISMPVSMRTEDDPMGGNRFAGAFFAAPAGIADPGERIRAMRDRVEAVRGEPALDFLNSVMPVLNRTPSAMASAAMSALNKGAVLTTSSWPGVTREVYVAGAKLERLYVFAPLPGTRLTAAMNSHVGRCCIGINADGDVFHDIELLWECMEAGLDEILALGSTP